MSEKAKNAAIALYKTMIKLINRLCDIIADFILTYFNLNPQITKLRPLSCKKFAIEWRLNLQEKRKDTMLKNYKGRLLNMKNY